MGENEAEPAVFVSWLSVFDSADGDLLWDKMDVSIWLFLSVFGAVLAALLPGFAALGAARGRLQSHLKSRERRISPAFIDCNRVYRGLVLTISLNLSKICMVWGCFSFSSLLPEEGTHLNAHISHLMKFLASAPIVLGKSPTGTAGHAE